MQETIDSMFTHDQVDAIVAETCPGNSENHGHMIKNNELRIINRGIELTPVILNNKLLFVHKII